MRPLPGDARTFEQAREISRAQVQYGRQVLAQCRILARSYTRDGDGKFSSTGSGRVAGTDLIAAGRGEEIAQSALAAADANSYDFDREQFDPLAGRMLYDGGGVGPHGDEALHDIAARQGFEGPAQSVSAKDMDAGIRQGDAEMFRGVKASHDGKLTPGQVHERMRSGEPYHGLGFSGNGTYLSNSRTLASGYGTVGRYALHRDARVVDYRQLQHEQTDYIRSVGRDSPQGRVFSDPGRYAAARGYDAIRWRRGEEAGKQPGEEDEFIVLNRTAMLAEV